MLRRADPHVQVRLSTPRKLFALCLHLVSYIIAITASKSRPPNSVLTLVNWWSKKTHRTLHHADTDEEMVSQYSAMYLDSTNKEGDQLPIFKSDTDESKRKGKYIMGRRNWCEITLEETSGDLSFDIRVEKRKGYGETVG
jgi:hypothetical protein